MQATERAVMPDMEAIRRQAAAYAPGHSLERMFYVSPDAFDRDIARVWCESWLWAGHVSEVSNVGDFIVFEFGSESIIVVRAKDGELKAHLNVCRHRGSRVCLDSCGNARAFVCPYHGWTYGLDGSLRRARAMPEDFDRKPYALGKVHLLVFQGLIFINLSKDPPALQDALARLEPHVAPFDIGNLKIAHAAQYPVPANWKLALENYLECYHCATAHKEYSRSHSLKDPATMTKALLDSMRMRAASAGTSTQEIGATGADAHPPGADIYHRRYPLYEGYDTGSEDGRPVAPLLGTVKRFDSGASDIQIGPMNHFLAYCDHVVGYRFVPRSVQQTDIHVVWMVRGDAEEGRDYALGPLTWLWDITTRADERIIRNNQAGVNSVRYRPGPLAPMEWGISNFLGWYARMVK